MDTVALFVEDLVEDAEFIYPFYRLQEAGYRVEVLAPRPGSFKGKRGGTFPAAKAADPDDADGYAGLFIPGGYAPDRLRRSEKILELVRRVYAAGKPVAAVCHAPWVLISAGIVGGKNVTGFPSIRDDNESEIAALRVGAAGTAAPVFAAARTAPLKKAVR